MFYFFIIYSVNVYLLIPELYRTVISYILIFVHLSFYEKLSVLHVPVFLFTVCKLFFPCTNLLLPRYIWELIVKSHWFLISVTLANVPKRNSSTNLNLSS